MRSSHASRLAVALALAAVLVGPRGATAASTPSSEVRREGPSWSLGLGAVFSPRPYPDADADITPIPILTVKAGRFFFEGVRIGATALDTEHFDLDVLAQVRFDGREEDDSPVLVGTDEREKSVDAGLRLSADWERAELSVVAVTDVLGRHDGHEVSTGLGFPVKAGGWRITPGVGLTWQSAELADYYYGVRVDEALPERAAYEVGEAWNPRVEVRFFRLFADRKWTFLASVRHEWLDDAIRDSPVVDASGVFGGFVGFARNFGGRRP